MSHRILAVSIAIAAMAAIAPAGASANYVMAKKQAISFARSDVTARYVSLELGDDSNVTISCRPSKDMKLNQREGDRFHRWVCDWKSPTLEDTSCSGRVLIVGSAADANNTYYRETLAGARCTG